jgi:hypothetical protein
MYGLHLFRFVLMSVLTNGVEDLYIYILNILTDVDGTQYMTPRDTSIRTYSWFHGGNRPHCN